MDDVTFEVKEALFWHMKVSEKKALVLASMKFSVDYLCEKYAEKLQEDPEKELKSVLLYIVDRIVEFVQFSLFLSFSRHCRACVHLNLSNAFKGNN